MTRAAIYLRISLDRSGEMLAVDRQREDCMAIIKRRGWELVQEYSDNSISASKSNVHRPAYNEMVADFQAGRFDALVCWDLDRLTRQPRQLEDWIDAATERGLSLVTANGEADLTTDAGRLFARIKAAVAREEVERKGARQRRAALQRAETGRHTSFKPGFGYTAHSEIVEPQAKIVRELFRRFAAGETVYGLTMWLNESGVKPMQSAEWSRTTVRDMLANPRYAARVVHRGQLVPVQGTWEPIVEPGLFDTVQAILNDPRRKTNHWGVARKHLLTGIARCGTCGETVRGSADAYVCTARCHSKARKHVDAHVLEVVRARLAMLGPLDLSGESHDPVLDARSMELRGRLATIESDYDAGHIDGRRYAAATEKVQAELVELDRRRRGSTGRAAAAEILGSADPVAAFDASTQASQRAVIQALITVTFMERTLKSSGVFDYDSVQIEWRSE